MYKLILVDDEEEVRKGILKKIEWEKYGFTIVGEAENGREALEIAEKTMPDLVITDIKMPFMDGINLSKALREKFPTTKIVIITGFDEFEYAQKAIKLNVTEYMLKPISSVEVGEMLTKIKQQIDKETEQKKDISLLMEYYRQSFPILKEKFLSSLITSKIDEKEIHDNFIKYSINLNGNIFVISVISVDSNNSSDKLKNKNEAISEYDEKELLRFAALNITNEIVDKYEGNTTFFHNNNIVIISSFHEDIRDNIIEKLSKILEEIRQSVQKYLKITVTIGVGTTNTDISQINSSYENALSALDYRLVMGNNRIILLSDIEPQCEEPVIFDELKEHALISAMKVGAEEEIEKTIIKIFEDISEVKTSFKDYQIYLMEILTAILKVAKSSNVDMENVFGKNFNIFIELYKFNDLISVKQWITDICIKVMKHIVTERQDTCTMLVNKAKEYIKENYNDCDMTINKVCNYLHLSPTYFSFIFKKETKATFINYLTKFRMDIAKELLKTTNMKTFEIAERIGYSEANYFSYCFKKNFGVSPSEFRNN